VLAPSADGIGDSQLLRINDASINQPSLGSTQPPVQSVPGGGGVKG
jgi:hypothetical protein